MPTMYDTFDEENFITLLKGEPGTRKSTSALSWPTPQYWFSWDRKMSSLRIPMANWGINIGDVIHDDYRDWSTAEKKLRALNQNCNFKTVIVDSLTSCASSIMQQTKRMKSGQTRKSGAQSGKMIAGISVNELEDYNAEASALQDLLAMLKDLQTEKKVHVILIAHVIKAEYMQAGQTHISRTIWTAAKRVPAMIDSQMNEAYHFNIESDFDVDAEGSYAILTQHTGRDYARTGLPLPKKIIFGDEPLFSTYIKPAMDELKKLKPTVRPTSTSLETTVTSTDGAWEDNA